MTSETILTAEKEFDGDVVERRSVIEPPPSGATPSTLENLSQVFWFVQQYADDIAPFGRGKLRDGQLRAFITQENIFASALGIICSRNAGFSWKLEGPPRITSTLQEIFLMANLGKGWADLIIKTSIDLYTQDSGAFWEIVRAFNKPEAPIIGINHLDAARCYHTGIWEKPVIYQDWKGGYHLLDWWNVVTFAEMPVPVERYYGMQYCVLTRLLRGMQEQRNISIYNFEKTGGRQSRAIHMVKGITSQQLTDAMARARAASDSQGLIHYMDPVVIGTIDPKADVGHDTIEMVSMPDSFDVKLNFDHYLNLIAMAFESDYQEFAPLPGGGLGTGAQSEMLHLKARGKGPANFMALIAHAMNSRIMPRNMKFLWSEQDLEAEMSDAEVRAVRAQTRAVRIASFEITPQVARQMANDEGDLPLELLQLMNEQDVTPDVTVDSDSQASAQIGENKVTPIGGQPARIPSIRPPTPIGVKNPPGIKEFTREGIKEHAEALIEYLSGVSSESEDR